jgi:hypothetical protein
MSKPQTRKTSRRARHNVLEARVMSPRIAWFGFLKITAKFTKLAFLLAVLAALGWAGWRGIERAFYQNPDFRLQVIDLNPNSAVDAARLVEITGIDLTASLFNIHPDEIIAKLKAQPEVAEAHAERHLPGTLLVRVTPRRPLAWIACPDADLPPERRVGGMLVDQNAILFPCPELQFAEASHLPIIHLPNSEKNALRLGETAAHPELKHSFHLLDAARKADPEAVQWIESIQQINEWSLALTTRQGTVATFGLGDHERQIHNLQAANDHASDKGYAIGTINLIPKHNIPITLRDEPSAPRAIPITEPSPSDLRKDRRARDLSTLLNQN